MSEELPGDQPEPEDPEPFNLTVESVRRQAHEGIDLQSYERAFDEINFLLPRAWRNRRFAVPPVTDSIILGDDVDTNASVSVTPEQLCSGCYILGVQGVGKSSLLEQITRQMLEMNESVIVFDPHGQLIDDIIVRMPEHRLKDTYHLNLKDRDYPFGLNVFACADPENEEERDRTRNQVVHAFEKLWPETTRGVFFEKLLRHVVILLIEHPHLTLADVPQLLRETDFRTQYTGSLRTIGLNCDKPPMSTFKHSERYF